jgi:hypothetical protein
MPAIEFAYPAMEARPASQWLDQEPIRWVFYTDPSLDEELAVESLVVQVLGHFTDEMRSDLLKRLVLRYGVRVCDA